MTTTLAVNVSASLTYNSLSLATASKTSSATCLATNGAKFEDLPSLTETAFKNYIGTVGSVRQSKKYLLYLENYDTISTGMDALIFPTPNKILFDATLDTIQWSALGAYTKDDVVEDDGLYYLCIAAVGPSATRPASDGTKWDVMNVPTINAAGLTPTAAITYAINDVVYYVSTWWICIDSVTLTNPIAAAEYPDVDPTHWRAMPPPLRCPAGRSITVWMSGGFQLIASAAEAANDKCKLVLIQDEA